MKSLWNEANRREIVERAAKLTPDRHPLWGRMTAPQMVAHITDAIRMATGDLPIRTRKTAFRYPLIKQLLVYVVPVPKGLPTDRNLQRVPGDWNAELRGLQGMLDRSRAANRSSIP